MLCKNVGYFVKEKTCFYKNYIPDLVFFGMMMNFDSPTSDSWTKELVVKERTSSYHSCWRLHFDSF